MIGQQLFIDLPLYELIRYDDENVRAALVTVTWASTLTKAEECIDDGWKAYHNDPDLPIPETPHDINHFVEWFNEHYCSEAELRLLEKTKIHTL